jgi:hypothetical protein
MHALNALASARGAMCTCEQVCVTFYGLYSQSMMQQDSVVAGARADCAISSDE